MFSGWRTPAPCSECSILLFFVVFLRDNRNPRWERCQAVHMICVAVRKDHGRDRLGRNFGNVVQQLFSACGRGFGIDYDHSLVADDNTAISAATLDPINLWLYLMNRKWRRCRSLSGS